MKKILFFTPSCRRTGSEIVLYNLISNIDSTKFKAVGVVSHLEGQLLSQFEPDIFTISFEKGYSKILSLIELIRIKLLKQGFYQQFLIKLHKKLKPDIWYINTIMQPEVLETAQLLNVPCIVHSHELEQMLVNLSDDYIQLLISYPKLIITCSKTAENVLRLLGRNHNIEVCYPGIDTVLLNQYISLDCKIKFRQKYSLPHNAFIWLMSGITDVNKNPIRFIELAKIILSQHSNSYFVWLGSNSKLAMITYLKKYCEKLGISDKIRWVDNLEKEQYYEYFSTVDGFILTSNKESFSLVLLEAMYLQKLVISLDCGGPSEIINHQTDTIIHSWNNEDIAKIMIKYMNKDADYPYIDAKQRASKFRISSQSSCFCEIISQYFSLKI
jgi:glycosyltransferase involved in cell wall biosynthesis